MDSPGNERRTFLLALTAGLFCKTIGASDVEYSVDKGIRGRTKDLMPEFSKDQTSLRIGLEYLSIFPEEADRDFLESATIGNQVDWEALPGALSDESDWQASATDLCRRRHEADCDLLNMVCVSGLVLSRTEARLYGLIALQAGV
ncbi:MAG: hypothetical protein OEW73_13350 [Gammaproteobacteria bacterium]|nr:hypothetical protein [Gammaproteobacteria bacterium]MDH5241759.1 hypothetical protein [Gammaproteobacteria bacterium]MDH5262664.1 hypothetical protein [Gammaproteobacteria bacterium]